MKGNVTRLLSLLGAIVVIQSILWEYVRMKPEYQSLVEPWAQRGYEIVNGSVAATLGILLLAFTLTIFWEGSMRPGVSVLISGAVWLAAVGVAFVYGNKNIELNPNLFFNLVFAAFAAFVALKNYRGALGDHGPAWLRSGTGNLVLWLITTGVMALVLQAIFGGNTYSVPPWLAVAIVFGLFAVLSAGSAPRELGANRMLILATMASWATVALSAGAIRSALITLQMEEMGGISAQYKDAQITSGWFLANLGFVLAFVGAVAMWAKRRDIIINRQRAARQRAAADKSAAEIHAALAAAIAAEPPKA